MSLIIIIVGDGACEIKLLLSCRVLDDNQPAVVMTFFSPSQCIAGNFFHQLNSVFRHVVIVGPAARDRTAAADGVQERVHGRQER